MVEELKSIYESILVFEIGKFIQLTEEALKENAKAIQEQNLATLKSFHYHKLGDFYVGKEIKEEIFLDAEFQNRVYQTRS